MLDSITFHAMPASYIRRWTQCQKKKINLVKGLSAYSCHLVWYKVRLKNDRNAGNMARVNAHLTEWHFVLENKVGFDQTKVSVHLQRQIVCCVRSFHVA